MSPLSSAKDWARRVKRDVVAVYFAARDPATPLLVRGLAVAVAAYALSPIDLIPDFIPVLGYLDDLLIVPLGLLVVIRLLPPEVLEAARRRAVASLERPRSYGAAALFVALWVLCAGAFLHWLWVPLGMGAPLSGTLPGIPVARGGEGPPAALATATALTLAERGRTAYAITLAPDSSAPEKRAAVELAGYLKQISGAEFGIVTPDQAEGRPVIAVGPGAARRVLSELRLDQAELGEDGIVLRTRPPHLLLAGANGAQRGTLYAVYEFLESVCGVRWWTSKVSHVPALATLSVPPLDRTYVPALRYREAYYRDAKDGVFAARCRQNGHADNVPPEYGGHYSILGWCHTFHQLLPPERYFGEHPEWYPEISGKRVPRGQLCLTNKGMREELIRNALALIRQNPEARIISISQTDTSDDSAEASGACQCANCRAVEERTGAPSGLLLECVNQVAEGITAEYPDFLVETLAYHHTRKPPRNVSPWRNVLIRFSTIECSYAQTIDAGQQNRTFREDIEAWSTIAPQLLIWDYVSNFDYGLNVMPHPNLRVLAPNIRFFVAHRAVGVFAQGEAGTADCGDFPELRAWLLAHLMWDPARDERALVREFLEGYYGPAAEPVRQYLDLIQDAVEPSGTFLGCFMRGTSTWLTLADLDRATVLFDEAERLVRDDPEAATRVNRARMGLDSVWLQRYHGLQRAATLSGTPFNGPADPVAFCDAFLKRAHGFGLGPFEDSAAETKLRARFRPAGPPPPACAGLAARDWLGVQDNEFLLFPPSATTVDDARASDQKAARMPGSHAEWAIQYHLSDITADPGPWRCYVAVRCALHPGGARSGPAFRIGLYDPHAEPQRVVTLQETLEHAADGEYRVYDLGCHSLRDGMYFWVAPEGNANAVEAVFVDRLYCTRASEE